MVFCCSFVCIHKFASSPFPNFCFIDLFLVLVFILIPLVGNNIKACHAFHHHVWALDLDMDVFTEVLEPLVVVPIHDAT
jgi:hypothetical protein